MDRQPAKPGIIDRLRARYRWFDHAMRAQERYQDSKGDFYAAGITYFTIFALFPLLMVGFAVGGFVLASRPDLLAEIEDKIKSTVSGDLGEQLVELMDSAIQSRTSVGIIGLAAAAWAGLGWMANLREALSQMWGNVRHDPPGFVRTKLSDLAAIIGLFVAVVITIALTVLGNSGLMEQVLEWFGLEGVPGVGVALRVASLVISVADHLAAVHLGHRAVAAGVGEFSQRAEGGTARRGGLRGLQAGGVDLPEVGGDGPGGRDVRPGAGPDGVRLHHRAADPVRHRMGRDIQRQPRRRTGRAAGRRRRSRRACRFARVRGPAACWPRLRWECLGHWAFRG